LVPASLTADIGQLNVNAFRPRDLDEPGHLFVLAQWDSREAADAAMSYATHPNAKRVDRLVSRPRRRAVGVAR
jgi:quinol monooxygenase YgiN